MEKLYRKPYDPEGRKRAELLAPAGSLESLKAAINAGADAVYIGGTRFGARAYASNPETDQLIEGIDYAHLRERRVYLTVNTLFKEEELTKELYVFIKPLYEAGLDAVIVQDMGVLQFISRSFPRLPIHASTQMTVTGVHGARLLESCGVSRVVTARELSLGEIRMIRENTSLEIEAFVHGALCYCYSGQCLFSSMIGGRSGNRGRCAQPCRLPYTVFEAKRQVNTKKNAYILSPKDMCTVGLLPDILDAGVYSLKIEGRMKKPEYTAGVVSVYRKYLDLYLAGKPTAVSREDMALLTDLYNRDGFHESYYRQHNGPHMMAMENRKASGKEKSRNEELFREIKAAFMDQENRIFADAHLTVNPGEPIRLRLEAKGKQVTVTGPEVDFARQQPLAREQVIRQLNKTGTTDFQLRHVEVSMAPDAFMPVRAINELRREGLAALQRELLLGFRRTAPRVEEEAGPGTEGKELRQREGFHGFSVLVSTADQLQAAAHYETVRRLYIESSLYLHEPEICRRVMETTKARVYLALPHILRGKHVQQLKSRLAAYERAGFQGYLVRNLEEYALLSEAGTDLRLCLDANMYAWNSEAEGFYRSRGAAELTVPCELNRKELHKRDNHDSECPVYGYQVLMISAQCTKKNTSRCDRSMARLALKDRKGAAFTVQCCCDYCYNLIYNSLPTGLLKERDELLQMGFSGFRLSFTLENRTETESILKLFTACYRDGSMENGGRSLTKGHFQRGVE